MTVTEALATVRRDWARLVGGTSRITGDPGAAEDCVQEAFLRAWTAWNDAGIPDEPTAWVRRTARNLALDRWRRSRVEADKLRQTVWEAETTPQPSQDDQDALGLLFACAHPALGLEAQVALTLRWGAGLATTEVARAFLVSEETMTRRLTRAKTKVRESGIPLRVPEGPALASRLDSVLGVLYLLFNQGNDAGPGETAPWALVDEALALASDTARWLPDQAEPQGLEALMLLTAARRPARFDGAGELITLDRQDRSLWDREKIAAGLARLDDALSRGNPGPYTLQAAISGVHARADRADETDHAQIAALYGRLESLMPTPVVRLNRAVAVGRAQGPLAALDLLGPLADEPSLATYPYYHAALAEFLDRAGRPDEASPHWDRAEILAPSEADRKALARRRGSR